MIVLGIVGGIASGKSHVAGLFARLGGVVIDGDQVGHEVLREQPVIEAAVARWGGSVLDPQGGLSRRAIADRVFGTAPGAMGELKFWQGITHPRIGARLRESLQRLRAEGSTGLIVLDAAVMMETGWDRDCDFILFVDAADVVRKDRAIGRGWSVAAWEERERRQASLMEKRARADFVIDNSKGFDQTYDQVLRLYSTLSHRVSPPTLGPSRDTRSP